MPGEYAGQQPCKAVLDAEGSETNLCVDLDVKAHKLTAAVPCELVLHAGIPPASALQLIKEVCHYLQPCQPISTAG